MNFSLTFQTARRALRANLGRSLLTILGIVIGIIAIVLVVALGQGAQQLILSEVQGVGANAVIVRPGRQPQGPADVADTILSDTIKERDIQALSRRQNVPGAISVDPVVLVPGAVTYQENVFRPTSFGWTPRALQEIFNIVPESGDYFSADDIRQRAKVAVIGARVKAELFGESDAIGEFVTLRDQKLQVVGVLPARGQVSFFNVDELVLVPYSTAQRTLLSIDYFHEVFIRAADETRVQEVAQDARATLRELHGITDPAKDDFFVTTQQEAVELISTVTQVLTIFLVAIASISLLVGGIGIMNIMLVSVTERTHEIGLRKAVGATNEDIMLQFLFEAMLLTLGGGLLGTSLALVLAALVVLVVRSQYSLDWPFQVPMLAVTLGVGMAAIVGIVFGLYPARKAAAKDPIEALRYE